MKWTEGLARWYEGRIVNRMVAATICLLLVIQIAILFFVKNSIDYSVDSSLDAQLKADVNVWQRLVSQNSEKLGLGATVLASDFGFRAAVASGDTETIASALENHSGRIGATVAILLDSRFKQQSIFTSGLDPINLETLLKQEKSLAKNYEGGKLAVINGRLHQFVMAPVRAPQIIGWVIMGFVVDAPLCADMQMLTGSKVILTYQHSPGDVRMIYSAIQGIQVQDVGYLRNARVRRSDALQDYAFRTLELADKANPVQVILLRSREMANLTFRHIRSMLLLIDVIGIALFVLGVRAIGVKLVRPLRQLVSDAERIGAGDMDQEISDFDLKDEVGNLARSFEAMRLKIKLKQLQVMHLAYRDRLTGLPNRVRMHEDIQTAITAPDAAAQRLFVLFMDIARFKNINDIMGYAYGDRIIQHFGLRLSNLAEARNCSAARLGGDKFGILLSVPAEQDADERIRAIVDEVQIPILMDGQSVDMAVGVGVANWPEDASNADDLLVRSEVAMYIAKQRNVGIQTFNKTMYSGSAVSLTLLSELRAAIDCHELKLYLQPKIHLASNRVVGAEALMRWEHPVKGLLQPDEFIPFAESTGFIRFLTLWILEECAAQWQRLQPPEGTLRIAVNLSMKDLMDRDLAEKINLIMKKHNAPPTGFVFEITESSTMNDAGQVKETLNNLAEKGIKLSIDDFGTGFSSLAYLKSLPVHELKIDRTFVMGMQNTRDDAKIVASTIDLAHSLGLTVVAEGVENQDTCEELLALRCDEVQGYYICKPIPCDDWARWHDGWTQTATPALSG